MILAMPNEGARSLNGGTCPNCSAELTLPYCAGSGQRQPGLDQPLRELASEVVDAFLSFDARLTRTLTPLTTRPGFLTVEIPGGRQVQGQGRLVTAATCSGR